MKLTDPYPYTFSWKGNIVVVLTVSLFVAGFLIIFEPFGLHNLRSDDKTFTLGGYGLVNLVVLSANLLLLPVILPGLFNERRWTVLCQVIFLLWIVFTIGLGNYSYTRVMFGFPDAGIKGILLFQFYTLAIAVFPILLITLSNYNRLLKRYLAQAADLGATIHGSTGRPGNRKGNFTIKSSNKNESIILEINDFINAAAEGNYVNVVWLEEGKPQVKLIRTTLQKVITDLEDAFPPLFRVHRSYIVNTDRIVKVSGNAQGLLLRMDGTPDEVPVSRNYVPALKQFLGH